MSQKQTKELKKEVDSAQSDYPFLHGFVCRDIDGFRV